MIDYDDAVGWIQVDGVVAPEVAVEIQAACEVLLEELASGANTDLRVGDKPAGGTQRLADIVERVPPAAPVAAALRPAVGHLLHAGAKNNSSAPRAALQFTFRLAENGADRSVSR